MKTLIVLFLTVACVSCARQSILPKEILERITWVDMDDPIQVEAVRQYLELIYEGQKENEAS